MMAKTVLDLLHSLGVDDQDIRFDNFGGIAAGKAASEFWGLTRTT